MKWAWEAAEGTPGAALDRDQQVPKRKGAENSNFMVGWFGVGTSSG